MRIRVTATPKDPIDLDALMKALLDLARERRQTLKTNPVEASSKGAKPVTEGEPS